MKKFKSIFYYLATILNWKELFAYENMIIKENIKDDCQFIKKFKKKFFFEIFDKIS